MSSHLLAPVEFYVFEDGREVGRLTRDSSWYLLEVLMHERHFRVQRWSFFFSPDEFVITCENDLMAFIRLGSEGFESPTAKGEALLTPGLPEELKSDVLATYVLATVMWKILSAVL